MAAPVRARAPIASDAARTTCSQRRLGGGPVGEVEHPGREHLVVDELEAERRRALEQPCALAHDDGVQEHAELVDEPYREKRAHERRAARDDEIAVGLVLSSRSRCATSPETIVVLFQVADSSELETTYLG